jgi:hypothetical protein
MSFINYVFVCEGILPSGLHTALASLQAIVTAQESADLSANLIYHTVPASDMFPPLTKIIGRMGGLVLH